MGFREITKGYEEEAIQGLLIGFIGRNVSIAEAMNAYAANPTLWIDAWDLIFNAYWDENEQCDWVSGQWVWLNKRGRMPFQSQLVPLHDYDPESVDLPLR